MALNLTLTQQVEHLTPIGDLLDLVLSTKKVSERPFSSANTVPMQGLNWRQYAFRVRHYGMNRMTYVKEIFSEDSPDDTIVARRSDTLVRMYCRELVTGGMRPPSSAQRP